MVIFHFLGTIFLFCSYYEATNVSGCDRSCQRECIEVHNKYRANHGAPPLVFDQKLADEAQALIDKGVFKHSDWVELKNKGAAFAWGSLFPTFTAVIKNWHDEGLYYDYQTGNPKKPTQVWDSLLLLFMSCRKAILKSLTQLQDFHFDIDCRHLLFLMIWCTVLQSRWCYVWRFQRQLLVQQSVTTFLWNCFKWRQHYSNIATPCCAKNCRYKSARVTSPLYPQNKLTLDKDKPGGSLYLFPGISLASDCLILLIEQVRT